MTESQKAVLAGRVLLVLMVGAGVLSALAWVVGLVQIVRWVLP